MCVRVRERLCVCECMCACLCGCVGYTLAVCVVMAATCAGVNATYVNEVLNDVAPDASHATVLSLCVLVLELARAAGVLLVQYGVVFFGMWATFYLQVRIEPRPQRHLAPLAFHSGTLQRGLQEGAAIEC
jgi:hypothetical protein